MAYTIIAAPRAWAPVTWTGFAEDGSPVENRIELLFTELRTDPSAAIIRDAMRLISSLDEIEDGTIAAKMTAIIERMASDWRHVHAANGDPLKWSTEHVEQLLTAAPRSFTAAFEAYRNCIAGLSETRAGN